MKLGIIGGTSFFSSKVLQEGQDSVIYTVYGPCRVKTDGNLVFIPRHGLDGKTLPHAVNHQLHIAALKKAGVEGIISFGSVGSLQKNYGSGTLLLIDSYFSPFKLTTFRNREFQYIVPDLKHEWRSKIKEVLDKNDIKYVDGGVYAETIGPRFETPAEVKFLQNYADVVGMTCASETILAQEAGLPNVILAMVDNYANGVVENPLTGEEFINSVEKNKQTVEKLFSLIAEIA